MQTEFQLELAKTTTLCALWPAFGCRAAAAAALQRSPRCPPPPSSALINPVVHLLASTLACPLYVLPGNRLACRSWRLGGRLLQQMQYPVAFQNAGCITASACTHLQLCSAPPPSMAVSIPENVHHSPRPPFPSRCSRAPSPPPPLPCRRRAGSSKLLSPSLTATASPHSSPPPAQTCSSCRFKA